MKINFFKPAFLVLILSAVSGCAFGTRTVNLNYPPEGRAGISASAQSASSGRLIVLETFKDTRGRADIVGNVQNGFGMKTADIKTSANISEWVTNAIAFELKKMGYQVKIVSDKSTSLSDITVSGAVLNIYCTAYMSYEGEVSLLGRIEKDGKMLLEKPYLGRSGSGANWGATGKSFGKALVLSLEEAVNKLVADVYSEEQKIKSGSI